MAWIHRVRKNPCPIPERRNPRYNGPDTQWEEISKICKYRARSRSSSAYWAEKGSKKTGRTCSEHLHTSRCTICIRRNLHPAYTLAAETSASQPVDRKKFGYRYFLLTLSSRLLIGMHMIVYWKAMDEGAWEGPRRRNNILREQNSTNTFVLDLRRIIPLFFPFVEILMYFHSRCIPNRFWVRDFQVETQRVRRPGTLSLRHVTRLDRVAKLSTIQLLFY